MDFFNLIKNMSDEEIEKTVRDMVKILSIKSDQANDEVRYIGYSLDYNPEVKDIVREGDTNLFKVDVRCIYNGFIQNGIKIVFGLVYDCRGLVSNAGNYYYVDTYDYIIDFCKYMKDKTIFDDHDFFDYVLEFIKDYFGYFNVVSRDNIVQMVQKEDRVFYPPVHEHEFSMFQKTGGAMCTEYAVMAQNILSVFGYNTYYVIGKNKTGKEDTQNHAFNFIKYKNSDGQEICELIDFANCVEIKNIKLESIGISPFVYNLDSINDQFMEDFVNSEKQIVCSDYFYQMYDECVYSIFYDRDREYYIDDKIIPEYIKTIRK